MDIQINNILKTFGQKTAVHIPQLHIPSGTLLGLVGNNGAGKTTLFRLILDLIKADQGEILSNGVPVTQSEDWKRYTGSFIDNRFLIEFLTPEEYFYFIGETYGMDKSAVDAQLSRFESFMNGEILNQQKYIRNFSAGNKQKIGIVAAMMVEPQILILDEPFNFLDPSSQLDIRDRLAELNKQHGTTILISSHNLSYTTEICNRVILLEKGIILQDAENSPEAIEELNGYFTNGKERVENGGERVENGELRVENEEGCS